MGASKKNRHNRHAHYRVTPSARTSAPPTPPSDSDFVDIAQSVKEVVGREEHSTRPLAAVPPVPPSPAAPPVLDEATPVDEPPTVILTREQVSLLAKARPPQTALPVPGNSGEGYAFTRRDPRAEADAPTIILDVNALLAMPGPPVEAPTPPPPLTPFTPLPPDPPVSLTPTRKRLPPVSDDHDAALEQLRAQRLAREEGSPEDEESLTARLRQWWHELGPGIDRVLGRTHRAGSRGARATNHQTSAQLPVVPVHALAPAEVPTIQRLSQSARAIGERAQTAAGPALARVHSRAEQMAQGIVDRIDERFGGRPPLQHVLLGPGRMIISFAPNVTIREAQATIASVQARPLRRIVGYNAYLVLVPPGREARYAERLHRYRHVTGVHFGPQRPTQLPSTRANEAL